MAVAFGLGVLQAVTAIGWYADRQRSHELQSDIDGLMEPIPGNFGIRLDQIASDELGKEKELRVALSDEACAELRRYRGVGFKLLKEGWYVAPPVHNPQFNGCAVTFPRPIDLKGDIFFIIGYDQLGQGKVIYRQGLR
ncbi:hypothetical protein COV18_00950 [Candidatus Woesearchaeota archaeon CG10_big_fil_rev_8_21_14_0_10_37_12]|nr:MAG: hypothetical protein COV18_00950 [Candidatus Woesearchaeota archaeon CG10_big_fil_rev_8_21_14_0_10_37_12]